ncbi:MAG: hypothetical protein H7A24_01150 [Leptospiraceae bacterium]|nr:hypothetical protein [Leptospiraceae bacterium]MCP5510459.1 hypothetical protein [Leptospiraceae bacterium]
MIKFFKIFLLLCLNVSVFSYTPGKWSPMDKNLMGYERFGPKEEVVKNSEGKIVYTARYEYNEEGKLIKETYTNSEGKEDGRTLYDYVNGKLNSEEIHDQNGLQERRVFKYSFNGELKEIILYGTGGEEKQRCKVVHMKEELITEAVIRWKEHKETEYFNMKKDPNENVWVQDIMDEKKKNMGTVRYIFDDSGKLIRRENVQNSYRRASEIKYDSSGKIIEFSYSVLDAGNWKVLKTHHLVY